MKKCPFCAEEIQDAAVKCKHCGSTLPGSHVGEMCLHGSCTGTIGADGRCKLCGQAPAVETPPAPPAALAKKHPIGWMAAVPAGIGVLATFVPWFDAHQLKQTAFTTYLCASLGVDLGSFGVAWVTAAFFALAFVLAVAPGRTLERVMAGGCGLAALAVALWAISKLDAFNTGMGGSAADANNPFAQLLAGNLLQPVKVGVGLYLVIGCALAVVAAAAFGGRRSSK